MPADLLLEGDLVRVEALAFLLAASCPGQPMSPEECRRLYQRCVEESSNFSEYLICRDEIDRECEP